MIKSIVLVLLGILVDDLKTLIPQVLLVVITWIITKLTERNKYNAELKKLLGDIDSQKIKDVITISTFNKAQIDDLAQKKAELETALSEVKAALKIAEEKSRRFEAAYNVYKNYYDLNQKKENK